MNPIVQDSLQKPALVRLNRFASSIQLPRIPRERKEIYPERNKSIWICMMNDNSERFLARTATGTNGSRLWNTNCSISSALPLTNLPRIVDLRRHSVEASPEGGFSADSISFLVSPFHPSFFHLTPFSSLPFSLSTASFRPRCTA